MRPARAALLGCAAAIVFVACAALAGYAQATIPPSPAQWVTDNAALLSPETLSEQNARLRDYEHASGHQILVYIGTTTGGVPIEDWAVRAFAQWKVGRKHLDDGLVLFIFSRDHALRIEVGYGLEAKVPDVLASRIIRETIVPAMRAGQPDRAVTEGIDRILQLTGDANPGTLTAAPVTQGATPMDQRSADIFFLVILIIILFNLTRWAAGGAVLISGRRTYGGGFGGGVFGGGGFGGGGGGGFSGGGGMSGGGGASGSW
jgi:uncharacterized protein